MDQIKSKQCHFDEHRFSASLMSVPVILQDDDDGSTVEPLEDDAIEVIYDQTERLQQASQWFSL
jgi:hypothetical protein